MNRFIIIPISLVTIFCLYFPVTGIANDSASGKVSEGAVPTASPATITKNIKQTGHRKEISFFSISNNGSLAVTSDEDENNFVWDLKNGLLLREIGKPEAMRIRVVTAAFSPEASQLLWARNGKIMPVLWDVETGRRIGVLSSKEKGHSANIISMTFSADGRYIATGDIQGTVVIWNRADRSVVRRFTAHSGETRYLMFIPGKNELVSAGSDGALRLWGITGTEPLATLLKPSEYSVTALAVSADGLLLYAAREDMSVKGWMVSSRNLRSTLNFNNRQINSIALSPDNSLMALAEENESVLLWNIREGKTAWKSELNSSATRVLFSPDGKKLYSSGGDNWIREWDVKTGHLRKKFGGMSE